MIGIGNFYDIWIVCIGPKDLWYGSKNQRIVNSSTFWWMYKIVIILIQNAKIFNKLYIYIINAVNIIKDLEYSICNIQHGDFLILINYLKFILN